MTEVAQWSFVPQYMGSPGWRRDALAGGTWAIALAALRDPVRPWRSLGQKEHFRNEEEVLLANHDSEHTALGITVQFTMWVLQSDNAQNVKEPAAWEEKLKGVFTWAGDGQQ